MDETELDDLVEAIIKEVTDATNDTFTQDALIDINNEDYGQLKDDIKEILRNAYEKQV